MKLLSRDIHSHLLPGVDDGFRSAEESLKAIEMLSGAGVREFVFTPHINPDVYADLSEARIREAYEKFLPLIPAGIRTALSAEYMVHADFDKLVSRNAADMLCYEDRSILIEMSYYFRSPNLKNAVFELQMAGFNPILAHPERYLYMADSLEEFDALHDCGCRFQMNYISFTGAYGLNSTRIIRYLQKRGFCDFVATDLHSIRQAEIIINDNPSLFLRKPYSYITDSLL